MQIKSKQMWIALLACSYLAGMSGLGETAPESDSTPTSTTAATVTDGKDTAQPSGAAVDSQKITAKSADPNTSGSEAGKGTKKNQKKSAAEKVPITVVADELYMNDANGAVIARGNVKITQATQLIVTDLANGNTKQQEFWVNDPAAFSDSFSDIHLNTEGLRYNYQSKEGSLSKVKGTVGAEHVTGEDAVTFNGEIVIQNGTMTRCPAKVPDYHLSADKIEIWPNQKMIAYNAKFWVGSMLLYTTPVYKQSLVPGAEQTAYPSIGYTSSDGLHIKQRFSDVLTDDLTAYVEANYYTHRGFKPNGGLNWDQKNYSINVISGYYRDGNSNWVKKLPEYQFHYLSHRIGDLPITYTFDAIYGNWRENDRTSWHQDYEIYFTRDPIHWGSKTTLNLGTGAGLIRESFDNSTIHNFKYDATIWHTHSAKFSTFIGYHYTRTQNSLFSFERADMGRELDTGFVYHIDKKNSFQFSQSYDMVNKRLFDQDYTWYHDLHCWQMELTYRARRNQWKWDIAITRW